VVGPRIITYVFWDLRGAALWLWEEFREILRKIHIGSGNVLAEPDPQEVITIAITSGIGNIDHVVMTQIGFRSDKEFRVINLVN